MSKHTALELELAENLDNVTASLESCLAHFGKNMTKDDSLNRERIADKARILADSILRSSHTPMSSFTPGFFIGYSVSDEQTIYGIGRTPEDARNNAYLHGANGKDIIVIQATERLYRAVETSGWAEQSWKIRADHDENRPKHLYGHADLDTEGEE